ncbi:hypothetical protein FQR65_LT12325 [Abscondita terminalis]|nr:hypothetical protein FQR65_LT12325 [Abscondita terminalis]
MIICRSSRALLSGSGRVKQPSGLVPSIRPTNRLNESSSEESEDWEASGRSSDEVNLFGNEEDLEHEPLDVEGNKIAEMKTLTNEVPKGTFVTPFDLSPPPVAPVQSRTSKRSQGAYVFTSTPNYR